MEDAHKYLLSSQQLTNLFFRKREAEKEYEPAETRWSIIGKYHERLWFQKSFQMSKDELLIEYVRLAKLLGRLEQTIDECKLAFHLHTCAKEFLHNSNKPFEGLNLSQHEFIQTELFT